MRFSGEALKLLALCVFFFLVAQAHSFADSGTPGEKTKSPSIAGPGVESEGDGWSLEVLQHMVIETSALLKSDRLRVQSSTRDLNIVRAKHLPRLSVEGGYNDYSKIAGTLTYSEPQPYSLYNYGGSLRVTLYDGFRKNYAMKVAKQGVGVEIAREKKDCAELLERFTNAYFDAANAKANIELYNGSLKTQKEQLGIERELLSHSAGRLLDVKNAELEVAKTLGRLQEWKMKYETALGKMSEIIGVPREFWDKKSKFAIEREPVRAPLDLPAAELDLPAVSLAREEWSKAVAEYAESRSGGRPVIYAKADISHSDKDEWYSLAKAGFSHTYTVNVDWAFNDLETSRVEASKKRLDAMSMKEKLNETEQIHKNRLNGFIRDYEDWCRRYQQNREIAALQQECLNMTIEEQKNGLVSNTERIDAFEKKQFADVDVITSAIEIQRSRAIVRILVEFSRPRAEQPFPGEPVVRERPRPKLIHKSEIER